MPNLNTLADKIEQWARARNIIAGTTASGQTLKLGSEYGELADAVGKGQIDMAKDAIGDMFVMLTIVAQQLGLTIDDCVASAYDEIKDRKGIVYGGVFIKSDDVRYKSACAELGLEA